MSIYDIDYDSVAESLTPSQRRTPKWLAWLQAQFQPLQWGHDITFTEYANGSDLLWDYFDRLSSYSTGDRVIGTDAAVYEANMDFPPLYQTTLPAWDSTVSYSTGSIVNYVGTAWISISGSAVNINNPPGQTSAIWVPLYEYILFRSPVPLWLATTTYNAGDTVNYIGITWASVNSSNTNNIPSLTSTEWVPVQNYTYYRSIVPVWTATRTYNISETVNHNGNIWVSLAASNTGNDPDISTTYWIQPSLSIDPAINKPLWQNNISYPAGTFAFYEGTNYFALTNNQGNVPGADRVNWTPAWTKICDSYIGVTERTTFSGMKVLLERTLNRLFNPILTGYGSAIFDTGTHYAAGTFATYNDNVYYAKTANGPGAFSTSDWVLINRTTFRQPQFDIYWRPINRSDIYIDNNTWDTYFMIGGADADSNFCYGGNFPCDGYIIDNSDPVNPMFTVYVPNLPTAPIPGFYDWLNGTANPNGTNPNPPNTSLSYPMQADKIILQVVYVYAIAGTTFSITTY